MEPLESLSHTPRSSESLSQVQTAQISDDLSISTVSSRGAVSAPQRPVNLPNVDIVQVNVPTPQSNLNEVKAFVSKIRTPQGEMHTADVLAFAAKLKDYTEKGNKDIQASMKNFVSDNMHQLPQGTESIKLSVVAEDGRGNSGAKIFFIRNQEGKIIAVAKAFLRPGELAQELRAQEKLHSLQSKQCQSVMGLAVGACFLDQGYYMMLQSVAPGQGVDNFINAVNDSPESEHAWEKAKTAVAQTAKAMAALHSSKVSNTASQTIVKELVKDLNQQFLYLKKNRELDHLRGIDFDKLSQFMEAVSSNFTAQPGKGVVVHGDPHPGNFFYDEKNNVLTMIDISTMSRSFGDDGSGLFPAAWDATLFEHKIADAGMVGTNLTSEQAHALEQTFAKSYQEADTAALVTPAAIAFCQLNRLLSTLVNRTKESQTIQLEKDLPRPSTSIEVREVIQYTKNKLSTLMVSYKPVHQQSNVPIPKAITSATSIEERMPTSNPIPKGRTPKRPSRFNPNQSSEQP